MRHPIIRTLIAGAAALAVAGVVAPAAQGAPAPASGITWNGASDRAVAADIAATQNNTRKNAAGPKITSNAHSADFFGIYFIWDSKQKDNGYLKVDAALFDQFDSFVLTSKESSTFWDFVIKPEAGQEMTADGGYVFFIPKVYNNKNINMVFVSEWTEATGPSVGKPFGFIGCYLYEDRVLTTTVYVGSLNKPGDVIDWEAVNASYDQWEKDGGLKGLGEGWQTSGYAPRHFADGETIGYADLDEGQMAGPPLNTWYFDRGCQAPEVAVSYDRYRAYVQLWNDYYIDPAVAG
ncbi:MAG: hypothetical protein FWD11_08130, partial [Micrococcales bacterium]|nr:hypothetical protein [Micrococcales bacterium]